VRISDYSPLNANFRRRLGQVLSAVRELVRPAARDPVGDVQQQARRAVAQAYQRGQAQRAAPGEPAGAVEGAGINRVPGPEIMYSPDQQRLLNRKSTRYERFAPNAGYGPVGWSTYAPLTLDRITDLHRQVDRQGVLLEKDDTDRYLLRKDPHAQGADRQRRSKVYKAPLLLKPYNRTPAAAIVCNFVRQTFDDYDGLLDGVSDMLWANAGGTSAQEVIWKEPRPVSVVTGKDTSAVMEAEGIEALDPIFNRYLRYDVVKDRPWIDMGGRTVDPYKDPDTGEPSYKVLLHKTFGDGHARQRGYMFALHYLSAFENLGWESWITVLETYGRPTPYLSMRGAGFTSDEEREDAFLALEEHGTGKPAVIHERWGELKHAPIPAGVDARGMHAAIIGAIHTQKLIVIQGETLSVELGGTGSYKAMEGHENQQENVQWIDAKRSAATLRTLARFIVEVNAPELARITGVPPEVVKQLVPRVAWFLDRTVDPVARLGMFKTFMVDMGGAVDVDQVRDEFHFLPPQEGGEVLQPPQKGAPAAPPADTAPAQDGAAE